MLTEPLSLCHTNCSHKVAIHRSDLILTRLDYNSKKKKKRQALNFWYSIQASHNTYFSVACSHLTSGFLLLISSLPLSGLVIKTGCIDTIFLPALLGPVEKQS